MTKILVVDDEFLLADMLANFLEDHGYTALQASNGRVALEMIRADRPDMVITDFMMPLMTGLELAQALSADSAFSDLPVVLVSGAQGAIARNHPDLFRAVFDKPFRHEQVLAVVRQLVGDAA